MRKSVYVLIVSTSILIVGDLIYKNFASERRRDFFAEFNKLPHAGLPIDLRPRDFNALGDDANLEGVEVASFQETISAFFPRLTFWRPSQSVGTVSADPSLASSSASRGHQTVAPPVETQPTAKLPVFDCFPNEVESGDFVSLVTRRQLTSPIKPGEEASESKSTFYHIANVTGGPCAGAKVFERITTSFDKEGRQLFELFDEAYHDALDPVIKSCSSPYDQNFVLELPDKFIFVNERAEPLEVQASGYLRFKHSDFDSQKPIYELANKHVPGLLPPSTISLNAPAVPLKLSCRGRSLDEPVRQVGESNYGPLYSAMPGSKSRRLILKLKSGDVGIYENEEIEHSIPDYMFTGLAGNGETEVTLGSESRLKEAYAKYLKFAAKESENIASLKPVPFEQFKLARPYLLWRDSLGRMQKFTKVFQIRPLAIEPLIYLYPSQPQKVNVQILAPVELTKTVPQAPRGWRVHASSSGLLTDLASGREVPFLFWEGFTSKTPAWTSAWEVHGREIRSFLESKLPLLGLNGSESLDFQKFWVPQLQSHKKMWIRFLASDYVESAMPLAVSPKPDTVIRVHLEYLVLGDDPHEALPVPRLKPLGPRAGFTLVEWGGMMYLPPF